jgi:acyl carrier protein phosphodiesterase
VNYLAHLFLADDTPESLIGNLLGDFLKGLDREQYSISIQQGIKLHLKVDAYTDSHQIVREAKQLISLKRRRYAGVLIDVFYDHFLAKHWTNYSSIKLKSFTQRVYAVLWQNQLILPDRIRKFLPRMIEQDWLVSYQEMSGTEHALNRLAQRAKNGNVFAGSVEELKAHYQELDLSFQIFFPELVNYVKSQS